MVARAGPEDHIAIIRKDSEFDYVFEALSVSFHIETGNFARPPTISRCQQDRLPGVRGLSRIRSAQLSRSPFGPLNLCLAVLQLDESEDADDKEDGDSRNEDVLQDGIHGSIGDLVTS